MPYWLRRHGHTVLGVSGEVLSQTSEPLALRRLHQMLREDSLKATHGQVVAQRDARVGRSQAERSMRMKTFAARFCPRRAWTGLD